MTTNASSSSSSSFPSGRSAATFLADSEVSPAIELRDARARISGRDVWRGVDLRVQPGEFVAVLGPNGSGKSTLLKAILGLVQTAPGAVTVLGGPAGSANREIGYLPQRHGYDSALPIRGVDLVRLGLDGARWGLPSPFGALPGRRVGWGLQRREAGRGGEDSRNNAPSRAHATKARVQEVIELVGATAYAERTLGELSGGEQQRILIAQALVRRPRILMLDEPLDSLDLPNQAAVTALVQRICRAENVAVLLVAHDVNPLLSYLDQVIYLAGGRALQGPVEQVITDATLSELYGASIEV
ncbi:MAG TPA: metal ABC transporter ATP-binding protein, partial [Solirubrobacteraceae bacterium]